MGIVETRKSRVSQNIFFNPKMVQDYGNRTADTFLAMPELGRWGILSLGGSYYLYGYMPRKFLKGGMFHWLQTEASDASLN